MPQQFNRKIIKYKNTIRPTIKVGFFFLLFLLILKIFFFLKNFSQANSLDNNFFESLFFSKESVLEKFQGRTNIILLGVPGGDYEGKDLTDSIIFVSLDATKKNIVELSIPRDIWSDTLKDKINTAYHYGEEKKKGGGIILAKSIIEEIVGQPVHYACLLDFSGFKKIIDLVGGVDVYVESSFEDEFYPIPGRENDFCGGDATFACRFEKLQFTKGLTHMDGETALKYARSRQAKGAEGTDFARGKRQQQLISALKNKLLSPDFYWQNKGKIKELVSTLDTAVDTDMKLAQQIILFKSYLRIPNEGIKRLILDYGDKEQKREGLLINPPLWKFNGEWVLIPKEGVSDYSEIHKYIFCNMDSSNCLVKP